MSIDLSVCPYCGGSVTLSMTSDHRYSKDYGPILECEPCLAWVGCHKRYPAAALPLGTVANAHDRHKRQVAHAMFDPLWQAKAGRDGVRRWEARSAGYKWLSDQLGLPLDETHIGMFNGDEIDRVITLCQPYLRGLRQREREDDASLHQDGPVPRVR